MKGSKKLLVVLAAIVIMLTLLGWVATEMFDLGWRRRPSLQEQLQEGKWIVRQLEQFRGKHGRYPDETEAALVVPGKLITDQHEPDFDPAIRWTYFPDEPYFVLFRFTGKTGERLWYSNLRFEDRIPRWYLQVEGGLPHVLPVRGSVHSIESSGGFYGRDQPTHWRQFQCDSLRRES